MSSLFWLGLTLLCIIIEALFAMGEMAIISLSRLRLQYYISKNSFSAKLILKLIQNPTRLFATALHTFSLQKEGLIPL